MSSPAAPARPTVRIHGGPGCPQRQELRQSGTAFVKLCVVCGKITPRVDTDGMPWCGGQWPGGEPG